MPFDATMPLGGRKRTWASADDGAGTRTAAAKAPAPVREERVWQQERHIVLASRATLRRIAPVPFTQKRDWKPVASSGLGRADEAVRHPIS
jgi:hypothetical protein